MHAHREHYYQRAIDSGASVYQVVGRVFFLNIALIGLAFLGLSASIMFQVTITFIGIAMVAVLLWSFARQ